MANTTILNAVSTDTTTAGMSVTGPCVVHFFGLLHSESIAIEMAPADVEAQYKHIERRSGPDASPVRIDHPGTYYLRLRLFGVAAGRSGTVSGVVSQ